MRPGRAFVVFFVLVSTVSYADPPTGKAPKFKAPAFPLEPGRRVSQPIQRDTFVAGATEAPVSSSEADELIPVLERKEGEWASSLRLGWFFSGQSSRHAFSGSKGTQFARTANNNPLSVALAIESRAANIPLSIDLGFSGTTGKTIITPSGTTLSLTNASVHDGKLAVGLKLHPLPRSWRSDIALGAAVEGDFATIATLTSDETQLDVDYRIFALVVPRIAYRFSPNTNWSLQLAFAYGKNLATLGSQGARAESLRRYEGDVTFIRYLARANALGVGAQVLEEAEVWTRTSPVTMTDDVANRDVRLHLFWRIDF